VRKLAFALPLEACFDTLGITLNVTWPAGAIYNLTMPSQDLFDCLIVGGGPAGLSAAIYMGRFTRKTIVLDSEQGRSTFEQVNENYLGFPDGIKVKELRDLGRKQAERFGVKFQHCEVDSLHRDGDNFYARCGKDQIHARSVILCTGVCDIWPDIPNVLDYVGKSLFWCITCDGHRTVDKPVVLFGNNDDAATTACQFKLFTDKITFISQPGTLECSSESVQDMESHGIALLEGVVTGVEGSPEQITGVVLEDGRKFPAQVLFSLLGCTPNNKLAKDLDMKLDKSGYVVIDQEGYTSVPGVFCAGDLSKMHSHQVVAAAAAGAEAGQTANYYLYSNYQKL
jgi:thioredoxin reductase (NADPH)